MFWDVIKIISIVVPTSGVFFTIFAWLAKIIINLFLEKDLEKFKSNLEKESIKFKIKYEKLHTERAEAIKEVYKKMVCAHRDINSLINPIQFGDERMEIKEEIAVKSVNDFLYYYEENRIFFEESLINEIDKLKNILKEAWNLFSLSQELKKAGERNTKEWNDAWKKIDKEVPEIKKLIENRFRKIIGIEN